MLAERSLAQNKSQRVGNGKRSSILGDQEASHGLQIENIGVETEVGEPAFVAQCEEIAQRLRSAESVAH